MLSARILSLALLALVTGQVPSDVVPLNTRSFKIPMQIAESNRDKIKEVILYSSSDQGATWNQAGVVTPDKEGFTFVAPTDGLYWFNFCVVDPQGNRKPTDLFKTPPRQKVLVDTLKPNIRIMAAERQGEDILVSWEIQEDHPDLTTLKLEYRTPDAPTLLWSSVDVPQKMTGQTRFRFASSSSVLVRMQLMDQAGNVGGDQKEVPARTELAANTSKTSPSNPTAAAMMSPAGQPAAESSPPVLPPPLPRETAIASPPVLPAVRTPGSGVAERPATIQQTSVAPGELAGQPEHSWSPTPPGGLPQGSGATANNGNHYAAATGNPGVGGAPSHWPPGQFLPLQITNSTQVTLDYEITKIGPSGVGSVELYLTHDEGQTWQRFAEDADLKPPMTVNLPGDGIFGLRLVVRSRAGLGGRPPRPGDLPQMRVLVDTKPPLVQLDPPQADPQRRDALLLTWKANDENLAANPITLHWAERPDGPWQLIAADLTNCGRYAWQLPPNLPYRVYLRVTARDAAGNIAVDETPEAIAVDLHEPEAQIKGILSGTGVRPQ
jgi:hypothetical protein